MRYVKTLLSLIFICLCFYSCDPCRNLDCLPSNYDGQFRVVSATDGKDLVFGPNRVYDKNQIKFYSLKGADTTFFSSQAIKFGGTGYDSIIHVRFFPGPAIAYMRLSNGDVDTLQISYRSYDTRCCGRITEITNFRFNNTVDIPGSEGTQAIKK